MKTVCCLVICCGMMSTGCVAVKTYNGIKPVAPKRGFLANPSFAAKTTSLRPTFEWLPTRPDATYELAIWESLPPPPSMQPEVIKGPLVYSQKGLTSTRHTIAMDLLPQAEYCWSVRDGAGEWMTVNWLFFSLGSWAHYTRWPLLFKTPEDDVQ